MFERRNVMKKYPNIQLLVLAAMVVIVGYFVTDSEDRSESFSMFLLLAGALAVLAVVIGLLRRPTRAPRLFGPYRWPGYTPSGTLRLLVGAAVVVILVGLLLSRLPVTCGGQQMRPGDECLSLDDGGSASYRDVAGAPISQLWIYLVIAAALLTSAVVKFLRRRPPTAEEVTLFEMEVAAARKRLLMGGHQLAYQFAEPQRWLQETLAQFEQEVEEERRRAGISAR